MDGEKFVEVLSRKLKLSSQRELATVLGKNQVQISNWKKTDLSATTIARLIVTLINQRVTADKLLPLLKSDLDLDTNGELAKMLGMSANQLYNWKRRRTGLTAQQLSNAVHKASTTASTAAKRSTIRPIAEFVPIRKVSAGKKYQLFAYGGGSSIYFSKLKEELAERNGVYLFYDSRGHALYAGKTIKQGLWKEMNDVFNRDREAQSIKLVRHPRFNFPFKTTEELDRQIETTNLKLHELAAYFSAFEVEPEMISDVEALLVRAFPNDLLNSKMERFVAAKARRATKKKSRAAGKRSR